MNRFQRAGLAIAVASGMVFAQDYFWAPSAPYGQTQFPWVSACYDDPTLDPPFDESDSEHHCYKDIGGWWFGYVAGPGQGTQVCLEGERDFTKWDTGYKSSINQVWVNLKKDAGSPAEELTFIGPDYYDDKGFCEGPDLTIRETGVSLIPGEALELRLVTGIGNLEEYQPDIAGFGVNYNTPPNKNTDISSFGGFCMKYSADFTGDEYDLAIELGWDEEDAEEGDSRYDTWISRIQGTGGEVVVKDARWHPELTSVTCANARTTGNFNEAETCEDYSGNTNKRVSGNFLQDGWAPAGEMRDIEFAVKNARAFKVRVKEYKESEVNFKLYEFGPAGTCNGGTNRIASSAKAKGLNFSMVNRIINMSVEKAGTVQIINLQGAIVHTQNLSIGSNLVNLDILPTGVYMVRYPALGYVNRIAVK